MVLFASFDNGPVAKNCGELACSGDLLGAAEFREEAVSGVLHDVR